MPNVKPIKLTELIVGDTPFYSNGISQIKVTRVNEKGENEEMWLDIPIQSIGVQEMRQEFEAKAPKPPAKKTLVRKDSKEAKSLGMKLPHDVLIDEFDLIDPAYLKKKEAWEEEQQWALLLKGLCIDFKDKENGQLITDHEMQKKALLNAGITYQQVTQIVTDINRLTDSMEETADFLSNAPSA